MNPHIPKELPLWEVESQWTPECSESDRKGQNPMARRVLYTIGKLLKPRCLKWVRTTHLTFETQVMAKRRAGSQNWQFDFRPVKINNRLDFLVCR